MKIGIDFDNTIVCYDQAFYQAALEKGLLREEFFSPKKIRCALKNYLKPDVWTELQGSVYGPYIRFAKLFPEVETFFKCCFSKGISLYVISHKTARPFKGPAYSLRSAAKKWISQYPFFSYAEIFFESTIEKKIKRINSLECDVFIDDLTQVLLRDDFPKKVQRILFDPDKLCPANASYQQASSWVQILEILKI